MLGPKSWRAASRQAFKAAVWRPRGANGAKGAEAAGGARKNWTEVTETGGHGRPQAERACRLYVCVCVCVWWQGAWLPARRKLRGLGCKLSSRLRGRATSRREVSSGGTTTAVTDNLAFQSRQPYPTAASRPHVQHPAPSPGSMVSSVMAHTALEAPGMRWPTLQGARAGWRAAQV